MLGIFLLSVSVFSSASQARMNVDDWYIQDFTSRINVNQDSTLDIIETIIADCGSATGKHGIFRILPTSTMIDGEKMQIPIILESITDQDGHELEYVKSVDTDTVTWKIGDPNVTVHGVNVYKIKYKVKNVIRFGNTEFDEFYWNLNGNFWDLQADHFRAEVIFPESVNEKNATVEYYTGTLGSKSKDLANYHWTAPSVLEFESIGMLDVRQGITASVIFPKNIFTPYQPTFWEKYGVYFFLFIPLAILILCFWLWSRYGKDPKMDKTVIAEYEIPGNLSPMEIGMLEKYGAFDNKLITAEIVFLATKGLITIKEMHDKILFFDFKDYELVRQENPEAEQLLNAAQHKILEHVFSGSQAKKLSSLKNSFYKHIWGIKESANKLLHDKKLVISTGLYLKSAYQVLTIMMCIVAVFSIIFSLILSLTFFVSAIIILILSFFMPQRTPKGAELEWKVKGFRLFMETVDKDRAAFYEKENIFEKLLPYAIVFGITKEWANRMQEIYGEEFSSHVPVWYVGSTGTFDADSFSGAMDSLSSEIATNTSAPSNSSSGSSGIGGSGGGGGGGGGGGW